MSKDTKEPLITPSPLDMDVSVDEEAETYVDVRPADLFNVSEYAETDILSAWSHHSEIVEGPDATHSLHGKATHRLEPDMLNALNDPSLPMESYSQKAVLGEGGWESFIWQNNTSHQERWRSRGFGFLRRKARNSLCRSAAHGSLEHPSIFQYIRSS